MVAAALVGIIRLELRYGPPDEAPVPTQPLKQPPSPPAFPHERSKHQADQDVATILARPLFSPTRRPPAIAAAPNHDTASELARLSGVILSPAGKSAIFAGTSGGKPIVVGEGAHIGEYVVRSIDVGTVTVTGPDGKRTLHPAFDPNPKPVTPVPTIAPIPPWEFPSRTAAQR